MATSGISVKPYPSRLYIEVVSALVGVAFWVESIRESRAVFHTTEVTEEERLRLTGRTLAQRRAALQCLKDGGELKACNGVE